MTLRTSARIAGVTFIVYIVAGIASMALARRTHVVAVLTLITSMSALVLGVTLYAITREEDRDLPMLAMMCRVIEAIPLAANRSASFFSVASPIFFSLLLPRRLL